ncbi:MAG TPA: glycosyltransferase [Candidatus Sulfotelmatobacter sp.]|jgi:glycosyltransferase involved in cell wall biosynthesis|nr:glycosyltransferase [Candidatus Sulfotelmatobacter sp.]
MKVAIVHDYIKEYGGAERVLEALCEAYPEAPIYTAFYKKGSPAWESLKHRKIIPSWVHYIPYFSTRLHSPLRFLAPIIWGGFDFSKYDVVIGSASWYVTKGFTKCDNTIEICYCHTPPRWLYGYKTSVEWQRFLPVKVYGMIVGHFMRIYDFNAAQKVDYFIANSKEVQARIKKFYRRDSKVIYPPVSVAVNKKQTVGERDYYFIVARIVGGKGLELAVETAKKLDIKLKIAGAPAGYYTGHKQLQEEATNNIEFLGRVSDEALVSLYSGAKAFLALATDEDFGITPVEAMLCGTPVIAYYGGGYKETIIDGKTGVFFYESTVASLTAAINQFEKMKFDPKICKKQAENFSKERFIHEIKAFIANKLKK